MSESKNDIPAEVEKNLVLEKALDEEIAKARSNEAATADAVVTAPFFAVHTKHSCDVCFQQPSSARGSLPVTARTLIFAPAALTPTAGQRLDWRRRCWVSVHMTIILVLLIEEHIMVLLGLNFFHNVPLSSSPQPVTRSTALRSC